MSSRQRPPQTWAASVAGFSLPRCAAKKRAVAGRPRPVAAKAVIAVTLLALAPHAAAQQGSPNFPPPEFSQGYQFPPVWTPGARPAVLHIVDMGVLLGALGLSAWLVLRRRSRRDLVVLVIFSILYFGFFRKGCICAVGSIGNVAMATWNHDYALPLVAAVFFALPLAFALMFGRVFCGGVCPLGAAQELVLLRPLRVPRWLDQALGALPFVYLGVAVYFAANAAELIICRYDPFVLFFRLGGSALMLGIGAGVLVLSTVVGRPYCRYLCPYGVLLRLCASLARWQVRTTPGQCVVCHLCAEACPYGAIRPPTPELAPGRRTEGRARLALTLVLLPILVAGGAGLVRLSSPTLAHVHPKIRLAQRVWLEQEGRVQGHTEASEAFETLGQSSVELFREAGEIRRRFDTGAWWLGGWLGLVFGLRMVALSIRRRRTEYEVDPASCVACGRCYASCPVGREDLGPEALAALQVLARGENSR